MVGLDDLELAGGGRWARWAELTIGSGVTARTSLALTHSGRAALDRCTLVPRELPDFASAR